MKLPQPQQDLIPLVQMRTYLLFQQTAGLGQGDAIGAAHKQLNAQFLFQIGQRFADGLLADKTSFGGAAKAVLFTDGEKKLKLLVFHKIVTLLTTTICNGVKIN